MIRWLLLLAVLVSTIVFGILSYTDDKSEKVWNDVFLPEDPPHRTIEPTPKWEKTDDSPPPCLIYVHLGSDIPWLIYETIDQLRDLNPDPLPVVILYDHEQVGLFLQGFRRFGVKSVQVPSGNNSLQIGLFNLSLRRFQILEDYMEQNQIHSCLHMEYDNLLYLPIKDLHHLLYVHARERISFPKDNDHRALGSIMYLPLQGLKLFNEKVREWEAKSFETRKQGDQMNDMQCLAAFDREFPEYTYLLPISPGKSFCIRDKTCNFSDNFPELNIIFDGACLGQYVGGLDQIHIFHESKGFVNEMSVILPNRTTFRVEFKMEHEKRIPYLVIVENDSDVWYRIANLHIHSKKLQEHRSTLRMDEYDIIQGEKFKAMADWEWDGKKMIKHRNSEGVPVIYCKSEIVGSFFENNEFKEGVILISHNSDENIDERYEKYLEKPWLIRWFSQNVMISHPKLILLPIGIANSEWKHGDTKSLVDSMIFHESKQVLYNNFSAGTHPSRKLLLKDINVKESSRKPFPDFVKELRDHKYILCPQGNGADTHRLWETFYLGKIPVLTDNMYQCEELNLPKDYGNTISPVWSGKNDIYNKLREPSYEQTFANNGRRHWRTSFWKYRIQLEKMYGRHQFDVVIPVHKKDMGILPSTILSLQTHAIGLRKIFVIGKWIIKRCLPHGVEFVDEDDESLFPSFKDIKKVIKSSRTGWYFQQFLKLYAYKIPSILPHYMSFDADTVLCFPSVFLSTKGTSFMGYGHEFVHGQYARHGKKLGVKMVKDYSFIAHHMMFEKDKVKQMMKSTGGWEKWIQSIEDEFKREGYSGMSEFQIWGSYLNQFHPESFEMRWMSIHAARNQSAFDQYQTFPRCTLLSYHSYMRR